MDAAAEHCARLTDLDVSSCTSIADVRIIPIAEGGRLRALSVAHSLITDTAITAVAMHCPGLTALNVSGTRGEITDDSIATIGKRCRSLRSLDVTHTWRRVTLASLRLVRRPGCRILRDPEPI